MTTNDELIQRANRWLSWYDATVRVLHTHVPVMSEEGQVLIRELSVALRPVDLPVSTQRNPSPMDLPTWVWLARYASPLEGQ